MRKGGGGGGCLGQLRGPYTLACISIYTSDNAKLCLSGWQGTLYTKGQKCNEATIPTNAFCLQRKALLRGN